MTLLSFDWRFSIARDSFELKCELSTQASLLHIVGRNGAGKTSILHALAGLLKCSGYIGMGSEVWQDDAGRVRVSPALRGIGMMFQDLRLFDHMRVKKNLTYGMPQGGAGEAAIRKRLNDIVIALDLNHLLGRRIGDLSGGEAKRVALGRALGRDAQIIILDEPFANVDEKNRALMTQAISERISAGTPCVIATQSDEDLLDLPEVCVRLEIRDGLLRPG